LSLVLGHGVGWGSQGLGVEIGFRWSG
jgi:hypothetical protein